MLHFLSAQLSQTRVMPDGDGNACSLEVRHLAGTNDCFICFLLRQFIPGVTLLTAGSPVMTLIAASPVIMKCLVVSLSGSPGILLQMMALLALFMRLTPDNLLTSWSGSDLSDIRESELNFLGLLIPGPLPTHIMGKINWNKSSLDYNGSNDKWATQ